MIDYDWSICAGNWMWVSSSAFEKALDCPKCFDPVRYGQRMDPNGEYIRYATLNISNYLHVTTSLTLGPLEIIDYFDQLTSVHYPLITFGHRKKLEENIRINF